MTKENNSRTLNLKYCHGSVWIDGKSVTCSLTFLNSSLKSLYTSVVEYKRFQLHPGCLTKSDWVTVLENVLELDNQLTMPLLEDHMFQVGKATSAYHLRKLEFLSEEDAAQGKNNKEPKLCRVFKNKKELESFHQELVNNQLTELDGTVLEPQHLAKIKEDCEYWLGPRYDIEATPYFKDVKTDENGKTVSAEFHYKLVPCKD